MTIFFAAHVHLSEDRKPPLDAFLSFLDQGIRDGDALYILGDLFDEWLGDDDARPPHVLILDALRHVTGRNIPVGILHGNHDFLLGARFQKQTGCQLLPDPYVIEVYGNRVLLSHGDILCTDDADYQRFRSWSRNKFCQWPFLALPMSWRIKKADAIRSASQKAVQKKPAHIMDVNPGAVAAMVESRNVQYLIHGHTHLPKVHKMASGEGATRIVLGDWYDLAGNKIIAWDEDGFRWLHELV